MKPQHLSDLCLSTLGAVSLHQGLSDAPGIFSILFIVGGIWMVGLCLFEEKLDISNVEFFSLLLLGFSGSLVWVVEQWGASQWLLAYGVSVLWIFGLAGAAITLVKTFEK